MVEQEGGGNCERDPGQGLLVTVPKKGSGTSLQSHKARVKPLQHRPAGKGSAPPYPALTSYIRASYCVTIRREVTQGKCVTTENKSKKGVLILALTPGLSWLIP